MLTAGKSGEGEVLDISRREFLRLGGVGLAGAASLGAAGCGGGDEGAGGTPITLSFIPDEAGGLEKLIREFNQRNRGEIQIEWREMPAASADYFEQIRAELQSGQSNVDVIGGDVIWPAQVAANGWILDLFDRFTEGMRNDYLAGPLGAVQYQGKTWGVP
jgi:multiple sugar transport system substrate-binding protein